MNNFEKTLYLIKKTLSNHEEVTDSDINNWLIEDDEETFDKFMDYLKENNIDYKYDETKDTYIYFEVKDESNDN